MRILVADAGEADSDAVLAAALRATKPGDTVVVAAAVNVPSHLPINAPASAVWKPVCRAERVLHWARRFVDQHPSDGVRVEYARIPGRSYGQVAIAGATDLDADLIVIGKPRGIRGRLSHCFGTIRTVLDGAPCGVRVIAADATPEMDAPPARRRSLDPFETFAVVAVNPAVEQRSAANRPEGQPAS